MRLVLPVLVALALGACGGDSAPDRSAEIPASAPAPAGGVAGFRGEADKAVSAEAAPAADAVEVGPRAGRQAGEETPSLVIRTGAASVEVDSLEPALAQVRLIAARTGGYVSNTTLLAGRDQTRSATLELKVPAARFDDAVGGLAPLGRVESVNVAAEDVSEEYVDVSARVANARRLEERLVELLATRTGKLADVLAVERELARVRGEIERYEGRLRFLRTRAAMSTLTVTLHEPFPVVGMPGTSPIGDAFRQAWRNLVNFVAWLIAASGVLVPAGALAAAAILLWRRFGRRLFRRPAPAAAPAP